MASRSERETTPSGHAKDCEWHAEQYPWECTCGLIQRPSSMTKHNPMNRRAEMTMIEKVARALSKRST
jgi:hypothetical protein